jgi:ATP-dependent Lhr-like helicase
MVDLGLRREVLEAATALGIREYTNPQVKAIPRILEGRHVLLVAPTGIGKTEAAILPLFHRLLERTGPGIRCLYITPLRALNRDMFRRLMQFAERLGLRVAVRHGDTPPKERAAMTRDPPDLLITTPETFQLLFTGVRLRRQLEHVRHVVVDEIHELAGDDRGAQLAVALERLASLGGEFQRIGLSATVGTPREVAGFLGGVGREVEVVEVPVPKGLDLAVEVPTARTEDDRVAEALRVPEIQAAALRRVRAVVAAHRSTLVFVNTRDTAEFLSSRLRAIAEDPPIGVHHGSLSRDTRIQMEEDFKAERLRGLICTSSLELGIDIGSADCVIQFNSPREVARLLQRVGRSGHAIGGTSKGRVIATSEDEFAEACVIARRAAAGEIEALPVRERNRCVVVNQVVAMALVAGSLDAEETHRLLVRAYPFRNLGRPDFEALLRQMAEIRLVWYRDGRIGPSRAARPYYFENLSMIPDVRTYRVQDVATRKVIGTLDEWFVAENAKVGNTFVMRGTAWRFVEFREEVLLVEPVQHIGEVPSWVGEDIPVPFEVAQEVGALRGALDFQRYGGDENGERRYRAYLPSGRAPVPTDRRLTLEIGKGLLVLNACFGSRVNETLGQLLSSLLGARFGQSVGVHTDPYRVALRVPRSVSPEMVLDILRPADPDGLGPLLRVVLRNSSYLRWAFVFVAKKFGVVRREVDWESVNIQRLLPTYDRTPLVEEILDKVFWERMDIPRTAEVLRRLRDGEIEVVVTTPTGLGMAGLDRGMLLVAPPKADHATLMALKKRLEGETAFLACLSCVHTWRSMVRELPARVRCPNCDGKMVASLGPYEREKSRLLRKESPSKEERAEVRRLYMNASLVSTYGRKAVTALVARGVGPDTAARILRGLHRDEEEFLKDVLAAELTYARTKRFWD